MLTSQESIVIFKDGRANPDRLTRRTHKHYMDYAVRMLALYKAGAGRERRELHRAVGNILADEPDCQPRRIAAFCKLLDDAGEYDADKKGKAAALRRRVFGMAAPKHPLVGEPDKIFERSEAEVKGQIARELGRTWEEIDRELYADVIAHQRLLTFEGYADPSELLSRYNVAQVQACLYKAGGMTVEAGADFKTILRYAKFARLLHEIARLAPSRYRLTLSGPASVLSETRRYGVNFARFIPALLSCTDWTMRANIATPWGGNAVLKLTSEDGLRTHLPPPDAFDSAVEEAFAARFGSERNGWHISRESEILHDGQTTFLPDFIFTRADGVQAFLEIVGFWTPEYLEQKRETISRFRQHNLLLAVPQKSLREGAKVPADVIVYKSVLKVEAVLEGLERMRAKM